MGCDEFFPDAIGEEYLFCVPLPSSLAQARPAKKSLMQKARKLRHHPLASQLNSPLWPSLVPPARHSSSATRCYLAAHIEMESTSLLLRDEGHLVTLSLSP